jgi:adenine/guanine/hypoxanthine permease
LHPERETNPRTQVVAGLATSTTMAYIVFVNLFTAILHRRYRPRAGGVFVATCLADAASVAMGLAANFPVAAGLALNAAVAFRSSPAHVV